MTVTLELYSTQKAENLTLFKTTLTPGWWDRVDDRIETLKGLPHATKRRLAFFFPPEV